MKLTSFILITIFASQLSAAEEVSKRGITSFWKGKIPAKENVLKPGVDLLKTKHIGEIAAINSENQAKVLPNVNLQPNLQSSMNSAHPAGQAAVQEPNSLSISAGNNANNPVGMASTNHQDNPNGFSRQIDSNNQIQKSDVSVENTAAKNQEKLNEIKGNEPKQVTPQADTRHLSLKLANGVFIISGLRVVYTYIETHVLQIKYGKSTTAISYASTVTSTGIISDPCVIATLQGVPGKYIKSASSACSADTTRAITSKPTSLIPQGPVTPVTFVLSSSAAGASEQTKSPQSTYASATPSPTK